MQILSSIIVIPAVAIITLLLGFAGGIWYRKRHYEEKLDQATQTAAGILAQARKEADAEKKEVILEAKEESHRYRSEVESELKERRSEIQRQENRLLQREELLDRKDNGLEKRENVISKREKQLDVEQQKIVAKRNKVDLLVEQQQTKLEEVAELTQDQAKELIIKETREKLSHDLAQYPDR